MLVVWFGDRRVGELRSENRTLSFTYEPNWVSAPDALALSPHLPLQPTAHVGEQVAYFFSNLMPEGPVLAAILKLRRLPAGDLYAQLAEFGEETAGAFSITAGQPRDARAPTYLPYPPRAIRADIERLKNNVPLLAQHGELRLSLAGAQNKIPVKYTGRAFLLPTGGAASTHILKPALVPALQFPDSVENEALCLTLARACGLNAVEASIVNLPPAILVVRRYDRAPEGDAISRLHQLDFCQLAGVLPDQKYEKDGGPSLAAIFDLVDQHALVPGKDRLMALDWVIFNYIIGNSDAHGKNLAMLVGSGNRLHLAPCYDILCTAIYPELDMRMAMAIGGEFRPKWVRNDHWKLFAKQARVNPSLLRKRAQELAHKMIERLPAAAEQIGLGRAAPIVRKISGVLTQRALWARTHMGE